MSRRTVTIEYDGIDYEVTGSYVPFTPGRAYLSNGDPGYPDEGGFLEDVEIDPEPEDESTWEYLAEKAYEYIHECIEEDKYGI